MCFDLGLTRRECIRNIGAATLLLDGGMGFFTRALAMPQRETIELPDRVEDMTPGLTEQMLNAIGSLSERIGFSLRFVFKTISGGAHSLILSFEKREGFASPIPLVRNEDGSTLHLWHTGTKSLEHVEFSSPHHELLAAIKERMQRAWSVVRDKIRGEDALTLGMKAVAIGVGLWIGVAVAGAVLAMLGFFLYYAVILALIIAGAMAIESFFQARSRRERVARAKQRFMDKRSQLPELVRIIRR